MDSNSPQSPRRMNAADRRREALRLRLGGLTMQAIGDKIGVTKQRVGVLLQEANAELRKETVTDAATLREVETARLDAQLVSIWGEVLKGDIQANTLALKIAARRAAMWGLDVTHMDVTSAGEKMGPAVIIFKDAEPSEPSEPDKPVTPDKPSENDSPAAPAPGADKS